MADTFTSTLGTLVMQTGNDPNTWGTLANASVFQILEDAIANVLTEAVTGGTLDLSGLPPPAGPSQVRYYSIKFTGALTSNQIVKVPNLTKMWLIENACTNTGGPWALTIQTPSGTGVQVPQGTWKWVRCDGSNGMRRHDQDEIGRAEHFIVTTLPAGYLECDGSTPLRATYPDLFNKLNADGLVWGAGNGITTFTLPNFKDTGRFMRTRTGSTTVGTYQSNQNVAHTHTGTADATSVAHTHSGNTGTESAPHTHAILSGTGLVVIGVSGGGSIGNTGEFPVPANETTLNTESASHFHSITTGGMSANDPHTHTFTSASSGSAEARPEAAIILICIRY